MQFYELYGFFIHKELKYPLFIFQTLDLETSIMLGSLFPRGVEAHHTLPPEVFEGKEYEGPELDIWVCLSL